MPEISRDEFQRAVEAGIDSAASFNSPLPDDAAAAVREVGAKASQVLVGTFYADDAPCGCPLYEAGLADCDGEPTTLLIACDSPRRTIQHFACTFDQEVADSLPYGGDGDEYVVRIV